MTEIADGISLEEVRRQSLSNLCAWSSFEHHLSRTQLGLIATACGLLSLSAYCNTLLLCLSALPRSNTKPRVLDRKQSHSREFAHAISGLAETANSRTRFEAPS